MSSTWPEKLNGRSLYLVVGIVAAMYGGDIYRTEAGTGRLERMIDDRLRVTPAQVQDRVARVEHLVKTVEENQRDIRENQRQIGAVLTLVGKLAEADAMRTAAQGAASFAERARIEREASAQAQRALQDAEKTLADR